MKKIFKGLLIVTGVSALVGIVVACVKAKKAMKDESLDLSEFSDGETWGEFDEDSFFEEDEEIFSASEDFPDEVISESTEVQ